MISISGTFTLIIKHVNRGPVWQQNVSFEAVSGVPSTWDVSAFVSDPDGDPVAVSLVSMSPALAGVGVSFDAAEGVLRFDGRDIGAVDVVGNIIFQGDDGRGDASTSPQG